MRVIPKPNISPLRTYVRCYSSFREETKTKFKSIVGFIKEQSDSYDRKATSKELYIFQVHDIVQYDISKDDMIKLYDQKMVGHATGRKIYDKLMLLAPLNKCPFCGFGQVSTLDHYLPKSKFPIFSVLPYNLIPCCRDCNTGKLAGYATTMNKQTLHPYYDDFTAEQWLFARVLKIPHLSMEYYVKPPEDWGNVAKERVKSHFINYGLAKRFSIEASSILADLRNEFLSLSLSPEDIVKELKKHYNVKKMKHLNSWETAMYQALYQDQWYCNGGYNN